VATIHFPLLLLHPYSSVIVAAPHDVS